MALSERDKRVLDLEREWWQSPGTKEAAIRARLGISPTRFYAILAELSASPEARAYDPLVVHRVRRLRALRRRARFEGRSAGGGPSAR
ncbi:MAG: DUF3263 domain-containing protein [Acidimicrobiia bacterium]